MRITPIEIHQKKFKRSLRGYNEEEVDSFLDEVAAELERLIQENEELTEKVEKLERRLEQYISFEQALQETMLAAQKAASDLKKNAENAAKLIIKDAQIKAEQIKKEAQLEKERAMAEIVKLKVALREYKEEFDKFLEKQKNESKKLNVMISKLPSFGSLELELERAVSKTYDEEKEELKVPETEEATVQTDRNDLEVEDLEKTKPVDVS
ncbi:MAG: DivIVA domain-containing protein [Actinobacteria bacterium]|nr:DivIVA domain-containing protein [Actinomycetota bacterium]